MKFDTLIIGGGLTGLTCAIRLQKQGVRCAVVSTGQSALHFSSGSFDLLGFLASGETVGDPTDAVRLLPDGHPYRRLGDRFADYAAEAHRLLADCGVQVTGDCRRNHFRYTPMGTLCPTWLTFSELATAAEPDKYPAGKILIVNFAGFLDFNTNFISETLTRRGAVCAFATLETEAVERLRVNPTEMRATNIAKALESEDTLEEVIRRVNELAAGYDRVVLPAVFGFRSCEAVKRLQAGIRAELLLMPTMPPSVPGIRTQTMLVRAFERLGGIFMSGDTVLEAVTDGGRIAEVRTANHGDEPLRADNFVLASGHFFSGGLRATAFRIEEPVFGADVDYVEGRENWYEDDVHKQHNYQSFGVRTDAHFRVIRQGGAVGNLYAAGSVLGGARSLEEGSGAGVAMLTALCVADEIMKGGRK